MGQTESTGSVHGRGQGGGAGGTVAGSQPPMVTPLTLEGTTLPIQPAGQGPARKSPVFHIQTGQPSPDIRVSRPESGEEDSRISTKPDGQTGMAGGSRSRSRKSSSSCGGVDDDTRDRTHTLWAGAAPPPDLEYRGISGGQHDLLDPDGTVGSGGSGRGRVSGSGQVVRPLPSRGRVSGSSPLQPGPGVRKRTWTHAPKGRLGHLGPRDSPWSRRLRPRAQKRPKLRFRQPLGLPWFIPGPTDPAWADDQRTRKFSLSSALEYSLSPIATGTEPGTGPVRSQVPVDGSEGSPKATLSSFGPEQLTSMVRILKLRIRGSQARKAAQRYVPTQSTKPGSRRSRSTTSRPTLPVPQVSLHARGPGPGGDPSTGHGTQHGEHGTDPPKGGGGEGEGHDSALLVPQTARPRRHVARFFGKDSSLPKVIPPPGPSPRSGRTTAQDPSDLDGSGSASLAKGDPRHSGRKFLLPDESRAQRRSLWGRLRGKSGGSPNLRATEANPPGGKSSRSPTESAASHGSRDGDWTGTRAGQPHPATEMDPGAPPDLSSPVDRTELFPIRLEKYTSILPPVQHVPIPFWMIWEKIVYEANLNLLQGLTESNFPVEFPGISSTLGRQQLEEAGSTSESTGVVGSSPQGEHRSGPDDPPEPVERAGGHGEGPEDPLEGKSGGDLEHSPTKHVSDEPQPSADGVDPKELSRYGLSCGTLSVNRCGRTVFWYVVEEAEARKAAQRETAKALQLAAYPAEDSGQGTPVSSTSTPQIVSDLSEPLPPIIRKARVAVRYTRPNPRLGGGGKGGKGGGGGPGIALGGQAGLSPSPLPSGGGGVLPKPTASSTPAAPIPASQPGPGGFPSQISFPPHFEAKRKKLRKIVGDLTAVALLRETQRIRSLFVVGQRPARSISRNHLV